MRVGIVIKKRNLKRVCIDNFSFERNMEDLILKRGGSIDIPFMECRLFLNKERARIQV